MKKTSIIITLSLFIILIPFLGFPRSWEVIFFLVLGLAIIFLTLSLKNKVSSKTDSPLQEESEDVFTESVPVEEIDNTTQEELTEDETGDKDH